jgi:hypothetical protein
MAKIRKFAGFIVVLFALTTSFNQSYAQSYYVEEPRTFFGGLIAGGNFTQVDGDNYAGYHKIGVNVGGIVYARFTNNIAGSLEILYSEKGSRGHRSQLSNNRVFELKRYNINLNYAEVPVMLNYFDKQWANFGAGLSYSQLIGSKESVETNNTTFNDTINFDRYPFKKYDLNFIVGGSLKLVKGLHLNLRFQYSLLPVRKTIYPELGRAEQYNNVWTFRLVYLFGTEDK